MVYIKVVVLTVILGLLAGGRLLFELPTGPEYMLCFTIAYAFVDKERTRAVIMSAVIAIISSALTDRYLLFCVIEYGSTACFISEVFKKKTKADIVLCMLITFVVTVIGESLYHQLFIVNKMSISNFMSVIAVESIANIIASVVIYIIIFKIFNPRKRRFRISVE